MQEADPIKEWAYLSDDEMMHYAKRQLGSLVSHTLLSKLSRRELVALLTRERHPSPQRESCPKGGDSSHAGHLHRPQHMKWIMNMKSESMTVQRILDYMIH